ncbi:M20/M25/M40 family metallo-hydrolase [Eisenibacter elegans]|uniref:M20/M25/M40 family metallo-hydrolase n=1 Tax=Eisenibacter elegans TaxID=997 RepID=UPI000418E60C|nr:M20/M25/M40 family metallo-hydrolase [Eisenibacter elegans]
MKGTRLKVFFTLLFPLVLAGSPQAYAQLTPLDDANPAIIRRMYDEALLRPHGYYWLEHLCKKIGHRLSGSPQAAQAVEFTKAVMDTLGLDRVYLQEVMVPHWVRGEASVEVVGGPSFKTLALGNSVGTGGQPITAEVVEVKSFEELSVEKVSGKIVFYNYAFDQRFIETGTGYGDAVKYRVNGAAEAAKMGAVAVVIRSVSTANDDEPHTGTTRYQEGIRPIAALAIGNTSADQLTGMLRKNPRLKLKVYSEAEMLPDVRSYNVIGEIRGSTYPDEIIVVGGHLDSWDVGEGAHDDGAGCVQSIEVLRLFKALDLRPKRTIRAVMFMNEENGLRGGQKYAQEAAQKNEKHIAAIESDAGGFTPRGFTVDNGEQAVAAMQAWLPLLQPYSIDNIRVGGGGADISPLRPQGTVLIGFRPDSQRYFDYHHTHIDTFDKVNQRELQLGAAAMAALTYLLSEYGVPTL